ncbi:MAG: TonB family protein [Pseudomonadota bacterium]
MIARGSELGSGLDPAYGDVRPPAPSWKTWAVGGLLAALVHIGAAVPFLAPPPQPIDTAGGDSDPGIPVRLAPLVAPPEAVEPPPEPEIVEEEVIEERAEDSPPPAAPVAPRETPDLPDIRPKAIPDLWSGAGAGGLPLEDYLALEDWLAESRQRILAGLVYPVEARKAALAGRALLVIVADRDGRIVDWGFTTPTGEPILDQAVTRAIRRTRRLPRIPEETPYEVLSFNLTVRFELVFAGRDAGRFAPPPSAGSDASAPPQPAATGLPVAQISACAGQAAQLVQRRAAIADQRQQLEALRGDYERQALRYQRDNRPAPRRVERMLDDYNSGVDAFEAAIAQFDAQVATYSAACGAGSATYENFAAACAPYVASGNPYCEAFTDLWTRLRGAAQ